MLNYRNISIAANPEKIIRRSGRSGSMPQEEPMEKNQINHELLRFLDGSPNSFFAAANMADILEKHGYRRLTEGERWKLRAGDQCYVTRNDSSLIAFRVPRADYAGFQILASHSDSPCFKLKPNPVLTAENLYLRLDVEKYGGAILSTWFDRPLSLAGRVLLRTLDGVQRRLVRIDRDLLVIPNLAIHMDRSVNDGWKFNVQRDLLPLLGEKGDENGLSALLAEEADCSPEDILDADLYVYNRMPGTILGLRGDFLCSGRLDDLQCAFASLQGFLAAQPRDSVAVHCVFDNEEVGSATKQGAASTFLRDTLWRINAALGRDEEDFRRSLTDSFLVSADNAHGVHPNHAEKADPANRPRLNGGVVIKYNATQKYATDAVSGALFRCICRRAGVPVQTFANRSDIPGGSTLGSIAGTRVCVNTVDVGLAQLAMHSAWETAGAADTVWFAEAARELFSVSVRCDGEGGCHID